MPIWGLHWSEALRYGRRGRRPRRPVQARLPRKGLEYMEPRPKRKPTRLPHFDYNQPGAFFVTLCTKDRQCILGSVLDSTSAAEMPVVRLSHAGFLVREQIRSMADVYAHISIDHFIVMPNHVHLLLSIHKEWRETTPANAAVPSFISALKRFSNKQTGEDLWQRSYHDHVVRNERDDLRIWQYIDSNAAKWKEDCFYQA